MPNSPSSVPSRTRLAAAVALAVLLSACGANTRAEPGSPEVPHGYVEGAEETSEAPSRLVVADAVTGGVRVLDLLTGEATVVGTAAAPRGIDTDGRFGYVATAAGGVRIVDSGGWTVDHGDHVHFYRAQIRDVGTTQGAPGGVEAHGDPAVTALVHPDGVVTLLDRARLDEGAVVVTGTLTGARHPAAVPYRDHVLGATAAAGQEHADGVEVWDRSGRHVSRIEAACPQLDGQAVTRRGVVFGCADGALLVSEDAGTFRAQKIPYPRPVAGAERARDFRHRSGSTTLVAKAGANGVWVLDAARTSWTHLATGPVVAVNTAGEGTPVLALTTDGVLHAYDATTGRDEAQAPLLAPAATGDPAPTIEIDSSRAYVNDPSGGTVHEIDYKDALRGSRRFDVGGRASYIAEAGR